MIKKYIHEILPKGITKGPVWEVGGLRVEYPIFSLPENKELEQSLNNKIGEILVRWLELMQEEPTIEEEDDFYIAPMWSTREMIIDYFDGRFLSFFVKRTDYEGGANSSSGTAVWSLEIKDNKFYDINLLSICRHDTEILTSICVTELTRQGVRERAIISVFNAIKNMEFEICLSCNGVRFLFDIQGIGGMFSGSYSCIVPYSKLSNLLTPEVREHFQI